MHSVCAGGSDRHVFLNLVVDLVNSIFDGEKAFGGGGVGRSQVDICCVFGSEASSDIDAVGDVVTCRGGVVGIYVVGF